MAYSEIQAERFRAAVYSAGAVTPDTRFAKRG